MRARQTPPRPEPPRLWLFTDERAEGDPAAALARLPRGGGIVFRHHATPLAERRALYDRVRRIARRRGLVLVLAGPPSLAIAWRADGAHGRSPHLNAARPLLRTAPAHSRRELVRAARAHADLTFLSPVFATRSHPGSGALGVCRFGLMLRPQIVPVGALGGMDRAHFRRIARLAYGWGAIDAWHADQKRKVVPR